MNAAAPAPLSGLPPAVLPWLPVVALAAWLAAVTLAGTRWRIPPRVARFPLTATGRVASPRRRRARRVLVLTSASLAIAALAHPTLGAAVLLAVPLASRWSRVRARRRASARMAAAMPDLVELVAAGIAAGCTARQALLSCRAAAPVPLHSALGELASRLDRGERFADALQHLAVDIGDPARPLAIALRAHERDGVPLGPTLERIAADARRQRRQQAEAAIRRLPVRLSVPLVVCTLSAFVMLTVVPLGAATVRSLQREAPAAPLPPYDVVSGQEVLP